jgi:hypothetical protein
MYVLLFWRAALEFIEYILLLWYQVELLAVAVESEAVCEEKSKQDTSKMNGVNSYASV